MDNISGAYGIVWLFAIVLILIFALFLSSFLLWIENNIVARVSYTCACIITLLININSVINLISVLPWHANSYHINIFESIFLTISFMFVAISLILKHKHKFLANITLNSANALCLVAFLYALNNVNA